MIGYSKEAQTGGVSKKKKKSLSNAVGKVTSKKPTQAEINTKANAKLDKIYKAKKMYFKCELRISKNCLPREITSYGKKLTMTYAHRHKRDWYKVGTRMWLLGTFKQTIRCCIACHMMIEHDKQLTIGLFRKHRPHNKNIRKEK